MDLRWGIRDEAQDDHNTIDFCIREIENCKRSSIGPSCLVSLRNILSQYSIYFRDIFFICCFMNHGDERAK